MTYYELREKCQKIKRAYKIRHLVLISVFILILALPLAFHYGANLFGIVTTTPKLLFSLALFSFLLVVFTITILATSNSFKKANCLRCQFCENAISQNVKFILSELNEFKENIGEIPCEHCHKIIAK